MPKIRTTETFVHGTTILKAETCFQKKFRETRKSKIIHQINVKKRRSENFKINTKSKVATEYIKQLGRDVIYKSDDEIKKLYLTFIGLKRCRNLKKIFMKRLQQKNINDIKMINMFTCVRECI